MSREIKFRGWHKDEKKMIYPSDFTATPLMMTWNGGFTYDHGYLQDYAMMQFTGLKDKNGKDCYEGDLIDGRYGKDTVQWNENVCGFTPFAWGSNAPTSEEFEIIGNKYKPPK